MPILVPLVFVLASQAKKVGSNSDKPNASKLYEGLAGAFQRQDILRACKFIEADFVFTLRGGVGLRREDFLAKTFEADRLITHCKVWITIDNVKILATRCEATVHYHTSGEEKLTDGKVHKVSHISKCVDTWVRSRDGWQLKHSVLVASSNTIDGRPGSPRMAAPITLARLRA